MASYCRGAALNSFKGEKLTQSERKQLKHLRTLCRRMAAVLAVIIILVILGLSLLSQFTGNISRAVARAVGKARPRGLGHTLSPMTGVLILTNVSVML